VKVSARIEGFEELARNLLALPEGPRGSRLVAALKVGGAPIKAAMEQLAPREPGAPDMAAGIVMASVTKLGAPDGRKWEIREDSEAAIAIGPSKDFYYGIFQEYGTVHHKAQPFARPAFEGNKEAALALIGPALWVEVKRRIRKPKG
jgi:HK97 gp10 family phage protein